ncbi:hypothetical protein D8674_008108 [Pyrus ussuriensis x Pyrus communis]|uniref:Uncharacterized protein n=1 Tax=Pyrus ussuriensis x Pyrus communis TaxID=2448454 RepID=A0A5N5HS51_9ROSA|nr:hypothetical protein D8674_008108 [Pyrus ussuriensis x Pyrus communis]
MMVVFSTTRMVWWWPELAIGRTGGESGGDAMMVMVASCYDVDIVEVDSVTMSLRESSRVGVGGRMRKWGEWTEMGGDSRSGKVPVRSRSKRQTLDLQR